MAREFKLPDLGEGIHEGEVVEILVSVGDRVEEGNPILAIETDKATTEIPSPVTGVVEEIRVKPGDVVQVGDVLMTFADRKAAKEEPKLAEQARRDRELEPREKKAAVAKPEAEREPERAPRPAAAAPTDGGPVPATPATRRIARELGVDLHEVPPTGPHGLVTAEDVRNYAEKGVEETKPPKKTPPEPVAERPAPPRAAALPDFTRWGPSERLPLRSVRRATAKRMALSWSQIPHVNHQDVADITELEAFRQKHKARIEQLGGKLTPTIFVLKALIGALKEFPRFNSSLDLEAEEIIVKHHYHIGVAVDTERGLIVPVLRDVDRKNITELAVELNQLVQRTRAGEATSEEMQGGTFTITNIGVLGGTAFSPIINYPEVAILGMAQARLQPVVRQHRNETKIVPRLMLPLILAFDHRVVDGAEAARMLRKIIAALEDTEHLLLTI